MTQWIPCSERLPEESGYYLTFGRGASFYANRSIHVGSFGTTSYSSRLRDSKGRGFAANVTHWMPLPEGPEPK